MKHPGSPRHVVVLGAGISGLAAARRARRDGCAVTVIEASDRPGGTFGTVSVDGFRFEVGPNTVQQSPALEAVADDAGVSDGWCAASPQARRRYLVRKGRLVALPTAPPGILTTRALSPCARARLLAEPCRGLGPGVDETMAAFVRRRLGRGASPLADAMVLGVYAGDPGELSVGRAFPRLFGLEQDHGSLLRGLRRQAGRSRPSLVGYRGGFANLTKRLASNLDLRTRTRATAVTNRKDGFRITLAGPSGEASVDAQQLIVALPAAETAVALAPLAAADALAPIAGLPHAPVAVVGLGFDRDQIGHPLDGFGLLSPHSEGKRIMGALFSSTLFPDCAPPGAATITAMVGGRRRPGLVDLDDPTLVAVATDALRDLIDLRGVPRVHVVTRWRPGIPQPTPASQRAVEVAEQLERAHPGLAILGTWRYGVGVPDCATAGWSIRTATERPLLC